MDKRKAFNHYKSIWDTKKKIIAAVKQGLLSSDDYILFDETICKVQFFEIHIDDVQFSNPFLDMLWAPTKFAIDASVRGYVLKKGVDYKSLKLKEVHHPTQGGTQGGMQGGTQGGTEGPYQQVQGEVQGEGEEKEKGKEQEELTVSVQEFLDEWDKTPFKKVRSITVKRKKLIKARLKTFDMNELFEALKKQEYLKEESWFKLDYVIRSDETWEKILDNTFKFKDKSATQSGYQGSTYTETEYDEEDGF